MDNFSIVDHCFVPHSHQEDEEYKDLCAYDGCGQPEIAHLWTVEAHG